MLYGHVFRNAMLIVIAGFPAAFISIFFTGSMLIEYIFSLDGLGLLGFEEHCSTADYPVVLGTLFLFSLIGLVVNLITDFTYTLVDPRIDFESRGSRRSAHRLRAANEGGWRVLDRRALNAHAPPGSAAGRTSRPTGAPTGRSGSSLR